MQLQNITINRSSPTAIYAQIAEQVKLLIDLGVLPIDSKLPQVPVMSKALGVNHNTVCAVYKSLTRAGYITSRRGIGTTIIRSIQPVNEGFFKTPQNFDASQLAAWEQLNGNAL